LVHPIVFSDSSASSLRKFDAPNTIHVATFYARHQIGFRGFNHDVIMIAREHPGMGAPTGMNSKPGLYAMLRIAKVLKVEENRSLKMNQMPPKKNPK